MRPRSEPQCLTHVAERFVGGELGVDEASRRVEVVERGVIPGERCAVTRPRLLRESRAER